MNGMLQTIIPKSDQLNADDLIGGQTKTIKVTKVSILGGDQPVALSYEGDSGKPYKPGKSMRRVLVNIWGSDANLYIGRSMTLYRDDKVKFGAVEVGGIRISHMSDMKEPMTMALTTTRANRKPFTVKPLTFSDKSIPSVGEYISAIQEADTLEALQKRFIEAQTAYKTNPSMPDIVAAKDKRKIELTTPESPNQA